MLSNFISTPISAPALWGKLPTHADFIQLHVKGDEAQHWQNWLTVQWQDSSFKLPKPKRIPRELWLNLSSAQANMEEAGSALPVAFVLAPGQLAFSGQQYVMGVMVPSSDQIGRSHPMVIYQLVQRRWLQRHWQVPTHCARDWQFWLARVLSAIVQYAWDEGAHKTNIRGSMSTSLEQLWQALQPAWHQRLSGLQGDTALEKVGERLLAQWQPRAVSHTDVATQLSGVELFPRADWPAALSSNDFQSMFWQQNARGQYIMASDKLAALWRDEPMKA